MSAGVESILTGVLGKVLGGGKSDTKTKVIMALMPMIISMLSNGGLSKILSGMKKQGLSAEADSWVSNGPSKAITAEQATQVVGADEVRRIAEAIGMSTDQTAELVAEALPQVVDHASPEGAEPEPASVDQVLAGKKRGRAKTAKKAAKAKSVGKRKATGPER